MLFITQGKTNIKYLLIIIILAAIVSGGILGYTQWQIGKQEKKLTEFPELKIPPKAEDEITNWKIYRDEKYGIEFQYPKLWTLEASEALSVNLPDQSRNFIQITVSNGVKVPEDPSMSPCQPGIAGANFQVGKLREDQRTFEEFVNFQIENPERGMPPVVKPKLIPVTVGGHNALKIEKTINNCKYEFYYVEQGLNHYMTISFIVDKDEDYLTINQILSTLKFIEPEKISTKEEACVNSGGMIETSLCCESASDFPNLCLIGACGCSPENSHQIKTCGCGEGKCFNGIECVAFQNP